MKSGAVADAAGARSRVLGLLDEGITTLGELETRRLLGGEIPFGPTLERTTAAGVRAAASELGCPVVVKALTPKLLHKSEHGLVEAGCDSPAAAELAAERLAAKIAAAAPGEEFSFSVQTQLEGFELAMGIRRDTLGPLCMVSAGGTLIELLGDSAVAMAPLDEVEALALLRRLRVWPVMEGHRGRAPADVDALVDLLVRVAEISVAIPELVELDLNPVFAGPEGCAVADARCVLARVDDDAGGGRGRPDPAPALRAIFEPRRIAVVGASADESKVGGLVLKYLRKHRWQGEIVAVNPKPVELDGVASAPTLSAIEGEVDLACIAVPAKAVGGVIEEAVAAGVPAGIVFSAGFGESGADGAAAQRELVERAGPDFRIVGPNTIGIASPAESMFATFGMVLEAGEFEPGQVGLISQSGAIASSLVSRGAEFGVTFSHWVSTGNEADLGVADYISYLAEDERTKVICLFLEAIRDADAFAAACARARAAGKPVVALKTGRSEAGRAAAISHTGAITGSDAAYRAFLARCGVIQVDALASLFAAVQGLLSVGPIADARMAIVSMSGGACSLLADSCADQGLRVPPFSAATQEALREVVPSFGGVLNPIDVTAVGIGSPDLVGRTLEVIRASGEVDLILVQLSTNADPGAAAIAADLGAAGERGGTPFLVGRLGSPQLAPQALATYREAGRHVFGWPDQLVVAANACVQFGRVLANHNQENR